MHSLKVLLQGNLHKEVSFSVGGPVNRPKIVPKPRWRLDLSLLVDPKNPNLPETLQPTQMGPGILVGITSVEMKSNVMRNVSVNSQEQNSNHQKFSAYFAFSSLLFSFIIRFSCGTILQH